MGKANGRIESAQESLDTLLNASSNILMLIVNKQIEKLSEDLLTEMQRKGPIRAGDDERDTAVETGAKKRSARR